MKHTTPLLFAMALLTFVGSAQDQTVPFPELDALTKEYAARVTAADGPYLAAVAELDKKYLARLEQEQKTAQQAGKLEEAMAIDGEKKAISSGGGVPVQDDAKSPTVLKKMHANYRAEIAKLAPARDKNIRLMRNDYTKKLDALVTSLTKDGKLQEAMTVKTYRESLSKASAGSAASGIATQTPVAGKVSVIDDPIENLQGDLSRKFMDIVEARIKEEGNNYVFTVTTVAPFPKSDQMRSGQRFDIFLFVDIDRDRNTGQSKDGNDYNLHLYLSGNEGWSNAWYKVTDKTRADGIQIDERKSRIRVSGNSASWTFPKKYLPSPTFDWYVSSGSGNSKNWDPLTTNPNTTRATFSP